MEKKRTFIKPCPCCGATAKARNLTNHQLDFMVGIKCINPECGLEMVRTGKHDYDAYERAVNAWNKRAEA